MTMLERYGKAYPCILDKTLLDQLPTACADHLRRYDYFLHYDDHDAIVLASWDSSETFDTIDALIDYINEDVACAEECR